MEAKGLRLPAENDPSSPPVYIWNVEEEKKRNVMSVEIQDWN